MKNITKKKAFNFKKLNFLKKFDLKHKFKQKLRIKYYVGIKYIQNERILFLNNNRMISLKLFFNT